MSLLDILGTTTGGVRSALSLLALMALIVVWHTPRPVALVDLYRSRTGSLFALSCITYSPAHAAMLLEHPIPAALARALDLAATLIACVALIHMLAGRALQRGVQPKRVRRGMVVNAAIVLMFVGVAWLAR